MFLVSWIRGYFLIFLGQMNFISYTRNKIEPNPPKNGEIHEEFEGCIAPLIVQKDVLLFHRCAHSSL